MMKPSSDAALDDDPEVYFGIMPGAEPQT